MRINAWGSDVCSSDLEILAAIFAQRDLADWVALLEGTDTCFAPVLRLSEVADHPHMKARSAYISKNGRSQCAPAPHFSRTPGRIQDAEVADELFVEWGERTSVVLGKRGVVRVDLGGRRIIKKKKKK